MEGTAIAHHRSTTSKGLRPLIIVIGLGLVVALSVVLYRNVVAGVTTTVRVGSYCQTPTSREVPYTEFAGFTPRVNEGATIQIRRRWLLPTRYALVLPEGARRSENPPSTRRGDQLGPPCP